MDARLQLRVQRYGWDRAAEHYERTWADQLRPAQERLLELAALEPGEEVLDVACGTGLVSFPVAEAVGTEGRIVATDLSEEMVRLVRQEGDRRGLEWLEAERAGAERLPFDDASFDVVLCSLGLMYVPDPPVALAEAFRVLRPGGRFVAAVWGPRKACGWAEIFPIVDARVTTEVCPLFFQLGTGGSLEAGLEDAGFRELRADRLTTRLGYDSDDDALGAAFLGGPVALAYSRFDDRGKAETHAEYLASIEPYRRGDGSAGYDIPGEFLVVRGEKPGG